jgi:hypothetical protein
VGDSFESISFGEELGELNFICLPFPQFIEFLPGFLQLLVERF